MPKKISEKGPKNPPKNNKSVREHKQTGFWGRPQDERKSRGTAAVGGGRRLNQGAGVVLREDQKNTTNKTRTRKGGKRVFFRKPPTATNWGEGQKQSSKKEGEDERR